MSRSALAVTGVLAGLLAGVVAALAIPRSSADAPAGSRAPLPPLGPTTVLRVGRPLALHADVQLRLHGRPRIEARAKDPLGGPEWAVRVFRADRVVRPGLRRPGVDPVVGRDLCAQLGRLHRGRFGWLDAKGTFHPLAPQIGGSQAWWCGSRRPDLNGHPHFATLSTITDPSQPAARVKTTIAWGVAGTAARRIELRLAGRPVSVARTRHNAYLVLADGDVRQTEIRGVVRYPGGRVVREPERSQGPFGADRRIRHALQPTVRAPDPNGGLPYVLMATHDAEGGWCTWVGPRLVGDRTGGVDYLLDVLTETEATGGGGGCTLRRDEGRLFREHPVVLMIGGGSGPLPEEGADPASAGRRARRTQEGTTIFSGVAAPGVVAVTLETPRDVRTLVPSGPAHAILAVYDGAFPTGRIRIVARFRDGHVQTDTLPDLAPL